MTVTHAHKYTATYTSKPRTYTHGQTCNTGTASGSLLPTPLALQHQQLSLRLWQQLEGSVLVVQGTASDGVTNPVFESPESESESFKLCSLRTDLGQKTKPLAVFTGTQL